MRQLIANSTQISMPPRVCASVPSLVVSLVFSAACLSASSVRSTYELAHLLKERVIPALSSMDPTPQLLFVSTSLLLRFCVRW
jgi:carbamoylphosphate synthase small subunit